MKVAFSIFFRPFLSGYRIMKENTYAEVPNGLHKRNRKI